jgi:GntR family transcriptional regulator, rspAB operon transcriptional repressor
MRVPKKVAERPTTLAAEAYAIVRKRLLEGEWALGETLSRRKLAAALGMSFLPVSEALLRLENEGLLESRARAGTRVRIPSRADVEGQYVVREALEVQAALLFTRLATKAERRALRQLASRVDLLSSQGNRESYSDLHRRLHSQIADGARCAALRDAIDRTQAMSSTWFCATGRGLAVESGGRHTELAEAVCSGDTLRCGDAVRRHIEFGRQHVTRLLEPYFNLRGTVHERYSRGSGPPVLGFAAVQHDAEGLDDIPTPQPA